MIEREFRLDIGDRNFGVVYLPDGDLSNLPVLVYCHGWGGDHQLAPAISEFRDMMIPQRWAIVAFAFYACGETHGNTRETSYGRWAANLRDILAWVRAQPWSDPERVGCWGISSGTNPCLRVAAENQHPAFVVSTATFITFLGKSMRAFADNFDLLCNGGLVETLGIDVPLSFYMDMIQNAPVHKLDQVRCPVFFLTGGCDNPFRKADALIGYELMSSKGLPTKQYTVPGGDHGLNSVASTAAEQVITWLKEIGY